MTRLIGATLELSALLGAGFAIAALLRTRAAALRHWILAAAVVCGALAPALGPIAPAWHVGLASDLAPAPQSPGTAVISTDLRQPAIAIATPTAVPSTAPARVMRSAASLFALVWIGGAILSLAALLVGVARLIWIGAHADVVSATAWTDALQAVAREQDVSSAIALLATDHPALLVTWGALAPKILIPRAALSWSEERIRIVLRHEMAHIRRRDWVVQMGAEITRALHWCNPLAWIACRRVREESEHACDDAVLRLGVDGSDYASHLLDLARSMHTRHRTWVPAQAIVRPSSLERRITAMLNVRLDRQPVSPRGRLVATLAMAAIALAVAGFAASAQSTTILTGTISDQLGGALQNAPIALTSLDDGSTHEVRSNSVGHYEFVGLPSGDYMLRIEGVPGFKSVQQRIVLTGATMHRDLTLRVGEIHETIRVTDGAPFGPPPLPRAPGQRKMRDGLADACAGAGGCIAPPVKVADHKPIFPDSQKGVGGVVQLKGVIDTTGHVTRLQVVGDANADLAQAAIDAVGQWEFEPTRLNGIVIDTQLNVSVTFSATR